MSTDHRKELLRFLAITIMCLLVFGSSALCIVASLGDPSPEQMVAREAFLDAVRIPATLGFFGAPVVWLRSLYRLLVPRYLAP